MKIKVLILFVLMVGCAKKTERQTAPLLRVKALALVKNPKNGFVMHQNKPFTGIANTYMLDGKTLKKTIAYQKGLKHGKARRWYDNGNINYTTQYANGRKQGLAKVWYRSGQLQKKTTYFKGVVHGVEVVWYPTGEKQKERYLVYGQEQGMQRAWRKNGILYANYQAVNGRIFGLLGANMCYKVVNEKVKK